ncbi:hypothetical protein CDD82_7712 [Ophiocordyceps australis]|uniref:Uncharacterized protein n=1 Tax=Ophiocordyceps australis TaxID=1399860 RepID=A0A2C5XUC2_9HYPO|nr:hypothetical protein CDD82_7712 [Ophiocordyceps australis]
MADEFKIDDKPVVKLTGPEDWTEWYQQIRTVAVANNIWRFIDPHGTKEPLKPIKPTYDFERQRIVQPQRQGSGPYAPSGPSGQQDPSGAAASPAHSTIEATPAGPSNLRVQDLILNRRPHARKDDRIVDLYEYHEYNDVYDDTDSEDEYRSAHVYDSVHVSAIKSATSDEGASLAFIERFMLPTYRENMKEYKEKTRLVVQMGKYITKSISADCAAHTNRVPTARGKLQELLINVWPGKRGESRILEAKARKIFSADLTKVSSLTAWASNVSALYSYVKVVPTIMSDDDTFSRMFLEALEPRFGTFTDIFYQKIEDASHMGLKPPTVPRMIQDFRNLRANSASERSKRSGSAYAATFQGEEQYQEASSNNRNSGRNGGNSSGNTSSSNNNKRRNSKGTYK